MEDVSPLSGSELFSSLGEEALARVAVKASTVRLERNDTLFNEGDDADELFVRPDRAHRHSQEVARTAGSHWWR